MATGNLLLGLGRRSIGDITLYRTRGQQRARARVRDVKNPRSFKQMATRAILSNVAQLYSLGRSIFDHSFEGYPVGQDNQLRFQKVNIGILRSLFNYDYDNRDGLDVQNFKCRFGARGVQCAVPFWGLQVSDGSLIQDVFAYDENDYAYKLGATAVVGDTIKSHVAKLGLEKGDIFTFLTFFVDKNNTVADYTDRSYDYVQRQMFASRMYYIQLEVKESAFTDETAIAADTPWTAIFNYYGRDSFIGGEFIVDGLSINTDNITNGPESDGGMACIRSRYNTDLRSKSFLQPSSSNMGYGLILECLELAWGDSSGLNSDPTLILPGENF